MKKNNQLVKTCWFVCCSVLPWRLSYTHWLSWRGGLCLFQKWLHPAPPSSPRLHASVHPVIKTIAEQPNTITPPCDASCRGWTMKVECMLGFNSFPFRPRSGAVWSVEHPSIHHRRRKKSSKERQKESKEYRRVHSDLVPEATSDGERERSECVCVSGITPLKQWRCS